jgi:hypothetical protein
MNRIVKAFIKAFKTAERKGWDRLYISVDLHETTLLPTWQKEISTEYYPFAKDTLKMLSERTDICLILWSCSLPEINKEYFEFFKQDGINFDYINENPECPSTDYADFDTKLYFSVGLDDKFGFDPEKDWEALYNYIFLAHVENSISIIDRGDFEAYKTLPQEEEYEKLKTFGIGEVDGAFSLKYETSKWHSKIDIENNSGDEDDLTVRILKCSGVVYDDDSHDDVYLVGCLNYPKKNRYYLCKTFEDILYLLKMKKVI